MEKQKMHPDLYWEEGQLIGPEHFEGLTNFLLSMNHLKNNQIPFPWGVIHLDSKVIKDSLDIRSFSLVMPDGQLFCQENAFIEGKFLLPDANIVETETLLICLAISQPTSQNKQGLNHKIWQLECVEQQKLKNHQTFVAAVRLKKLKKDTNEYAWQIDKQFIPPTFSIAKDSYLFNLLQGTIDKIKQCIYHFPELQEARAHIKYLALYQSLAKLTPFQSSWEFSPFTLYTAWLEAFATLRGALEINQTSEIGFPGYDHYDLNATFDRLYEQTNDDLERIVLSKYRERRFERYVNRGRFVVKLDPAKQYYILVAPEHRDWLESNVSIGYEEEIDDIIRNRSPKIKARQADNLEITKYRDGSLCELKENDRLVSCLEERKLVIHSHSPEIPEKLVLLFPHSQDMGNVDDELAH